jgi:hypothetical protein
MADFRHHKYTWSKPLGSVHHRWELVCAQGAIHFSASLTQGYGTTAGLEFHHLTGEGAPDHVNCPLTGGRCWHDGTSLYAMESLWPQIEPMLQHGDHGGIFSILEWEATKHWRSDEP